MILLTVKDLTHHFGGLCALSDYNLELKADELLGIIGPNGAGKTTIFNLITGVYKPTKGSIRLEETEISGKRPNAITGLGIARTFQNIRLFSELSLLDNIRIAHYAKTIYHPLSALFQTDGFGSEETRVLNHSRELLAFFGLENEHQTSAKNLPYGLQRQLEIARALATKPKILLLDEPAAGMNPKEIENLMTLIAKIKKEFALTIIIIEHQMRLVMNICPRIQVLNFGTVIAEGNPKEIQTHQGVINAYLGKKLK
jgi:branched-chain amino acid transport system ATP-binding protein